MSDLVEGVLEVLLEADDFDEGGGALRCEGLADFD